MSIKSEDGNRPDNVESLEQKGPGSCGPGCGCETAGKPSKGRWVVGVVVLAAAGVMVVRGMVKSDKGSTPAAGFANPAAAESAAGGADTKPEAATGSETTVGAMLGGFAELNTTAANTDAVFVFLPGKEGTSVKAPSAPMQAAARTIEAKGMKCGLFTRKAGCADYEQMAKRVAVPAVLALVKGRGMSAVSGEVTEAKLVQGYVAASSAGCGPGAGAGCCPK